MGAVGVGRHDQVDARHRLGQLVVLAHAALGAAVGQADHHGLPSELGLRRGNGLVHGPLGRDGGLLQDHAGAGGAVPAVIAAQADNGIDHPAPLQEHIGLHAVGFISLPDLGSILRRQEIGLHNGGDRITAFEGRIEHLAQAGAQIIVLVVAKGGGIVAHGSHHPQLQSGGGIGRLEQGAHGKVAAVHQNGVGVDLPLTADGGHQPGIAAVLAAVLIHGGQEVGVQIMGKEDRGIGPLLGRHHTGKAPRKD